MDTFLLCHLWIFDGNIFNLECQHVSHLCCFINFLVLFCLFRELYYILPKTYPFLCYLKNINIEIIYFIRKILNVFIEKLNNLFENPSSNIPDSLAEILLHNLSSGFYVYSDNLPNHGYYVTKELSKNSIIFNLCSISLNLHHFYGTFEYNKPMRFDMVLSTSNVRNFLLYFLKYYTLSEKMSVLAYDLERDASFNGSFLQHHFYINRSAQLAMWKTGEIFEIKNNECIIEKSELGCRDIYFILKEDDTVLLYSTGRKQQKLYPKSLESCILLDNDIYEMFIKDGYKPNRCLIERNICEFKFVFDKMERISVCMKMRNPYACWYFRNQYLFNILSKSIMENLIDLKNNVRWGCLLNSFDKKLRNLSDGKNLNFYKFENIV